MEVPHIVKLNRLNWKKRQRHRLNNTKTKLHRTKDLNWRRKDEEQQRNKSTEAKLKRSWKYRTKFQEKQAKTWTIKEKEGRRRESSWRWRNGWMITPLGGWRLQDKCASRHLGNHWTIKIRLVKKAQSSPMLSQKLSIVSLIKIQICNVQGHHLNL